MATVEDVRSQLSARLLGQIEDSVATLHVTDLDITENGRSFTAVFDLDAPDGRWRVTLESDRADMNIFNGTPDAQLVDAVASGFRIRLAEWWHTKGAERASARQGKRLD
ncbi:hypothetical protein [Streptomyces sp. SPB074]|uniref:hypothetical protein n=1 Tax=Streptomyces sp. (strain SPB074) TaxID=465543 RepID=UPI00017F0E06|nr:hypothetical protein [Streptomyces sp. SPB074]EDY42475.1 hypothetical protein SSBG_00437 [Streptomyces sp. SPB074]